MDKSRRLDGMKVLKGQKVCSSIGMHNLKEGQAKVVAIEGLTEVSSLLFTAEFFGVALAFSALGALVRQSSNEIHVKDIHVEARLQNEWLLYLAIKPKYCVSHSKGQGRSSQRSLLAAEMMELQSRLAQAENEVEELKRMRAEDAKANEKVVSIVAFKEQCWKNERKRLQHDNELLKQKVNILLDKIKVSILERETSCLKCKEKERFIVDLKEKLTEKEFLLITTMEEAKAEQIERNEFAGKLAVAEMLAAYVQERLDHQLKEHGECLVNYGMEISNLMAKQKELRSMLESTVTELKLSKQEAAALKGSLRSCQKSNEKLLDELKNLKEDINSKDSVLSVMLRKNGLATAENFELSRKTSHAKSRKRYAESERDSWRRIAEERINEGFCANLSKPGCSFGRRPATVATKISEMQRLHAEHVYNLHRIHKNKQKDLEYQVQYYLGRLLTLENCILCGVSEDVESVSPEKGSLQKHEMPSAPIFDISTGRVKECMVSDQQSQLSCAKNLVLQFMDGGNGRELEVGEWKKFYSGAKATIDRLQIDSAARGGLWIRQRTESYKGWQAAEMEQRHCREIDAFERQMRAKDERLECFRRQLLVMNESANRTKAEIEELKKELQRVNQRCLKEECLLRKEEIELEVCRENLKQFHVNAQPHIGFQNEIKVEERKSEVNLTDLFAVINRASHSSKLPEGSLVMVLEQAETELYEKDIALAFLEAKLVQAVLCYEKEKKLRKREFSIENIFLETLAGGHRSAVEHAALHDTRMEVNALSQNISTVHRDRLPLYRDFEFGPQSSFPVIRELAEFLTRVHFIMSPHVDQALKVQTVLEAHPLIQINIFGNKPSMFQSHKKGLVESFFLRLQCCPLFKSGDNGPFYVLQVQCQQAQTNEELACWLTFLDTSGTEGQWNSLAAASFEDDSDASDLEEISENLLIQNQSEQETL